jgi:Tfp pilus assembly protein PilO
LIFDGWKEAKLKIKDRQQLLTIGAVAIVALFLADRLILTPLGNAWSERSKRIEALKKKVADGKQLISRENPLRERWEQMQTNTFPQNQSLAEQNLLRGFDRWAKDSGITLTSLSQQWKYDAEDYRTLQCRVEGVGNLKAVSRFLYEMEKSPSAVRVDNLEVTSHDNEGQLITLAVQVSALVLGTQEQAQ